MNETENTEFKSCFSEGINKTVIAFANTNGGTILVGVDDNGKLIGLKDIDSEYTKITNSIRMSILPDVTIFTKFTLEDQEEKKIIKIEVSEGTNKPYYLREKGIKPSGVYVRQGASSVQASDEQIKLMIKNSDSNVFEEFRSLDQNLTFSSAEKIFNDKNLEFSEDKFFLLGIKNLKTKLFTNLALILSEQNPFSVKIAVFSDEENTVFRDRKEFKGSIFEQLEASFNYLDLCNQNRSEIMGLERKDFWDYPKEAVREALINALIHRDYNFSGSIIININNVCMEFISLGGFVSDLSKEDVMNGISLPRNKNLAEIFHRLNFIEAYGSGIRRIFALYKNCSRKPEIIATKNSFKLILPNMNHVAENAPENFAPKKLVTYKISPQKQEILGYLNENPEITESQMQDLLGIKRTRAYLVAREMQEEGLIESEGRGEKKIYRIRH